MAALHRDHLDEEVVEATLGAIVKDRGDLEALRDKALHQILAAILQLPEDTGQAVGVGAALGDRGRSAAAR